MTQSDCCSPAAAYLYLSRALQRAVQVIDLFDINLGLGL